MGCGRFYFSTEFQWLKDKINEINITLEMLEEKPLLLQQHKGKKIVNLSTSNNDTLTRSQSLNSKITLNSTNSQEVLYGSKNILRRLD